MTGRVATLGELGRWGSGGTPLRSQAAYFGDGVPWLKISDLNDGVVFNAEEQITELGLQNSSAKIIPRGAILVAMYGSIGKLGVAGIECATNQAIAFCIPGGLVDSTYLFWKIRSLRSDLLALGRGGTQPNISQEILKRQKMWVPPKEEQLRIVARIMECMERVKEIEELKNASRMQQQYLSASLIESELHPDQTGVEGWTTRTVGELVIALRNGRSIAQDTEGLADGAVLTLTAVRSIDLGIACQKPIALPNKVATQFGIDAGDIFISRANTIELVGLSAVATEAPKRLIYPDLLIKLKANPALIMPRYLAYALRSASSRKQIKARALGSSQTMVKISGERLREVSIPVPSLAKQAKIISRLDDAHNLIRQLAAESLPDEVEILGGAVLSKAFAGEL